MEMDAYVLCRSRHAEVLFSLPAELFSFCSISFSPVYYRPQCILHTTHRSAMKNNITYALINIIIKLVSLCLLNTLEQYMSIAFSYSIGPCSCALQIAWFHLMHSWNSPVSRFSSSLEGGKRCPFWGNIIPSPVYSVWISFLLRCWWREEGALLLLYSWKTIFWKVTEPQTAARTLHCTVWPDDLTVRRNMFRCVRKRDSPQDAEFIWWNSRCLEKLRHFYKVDATTKQPWANEKKSNVHHGILLWKGVKKWISCGP